MALALFKPGLGLSERPVKESESALEYNASNVGQIQQQLNYGMRMAPPGGGMEGALRANRAAARMDMTAYFDAQRWKAQQKWMAAKLKQLEAGVEVETAVQQTAMQASSIGAHRFSRDLRTSFSLMANEERVEGWLEGARGSSRSLFGS